MNDSCHILVYAQISGKDDTQTHISDLNKADQRPNRWLIFEGHFPQKGPVISGSFAERN